MNFFGTEKLSRFKEMLKNKKICIVVGTRPEIIKMSSVIKVCRSRNIKYFVVNTGQHYDINLNRLFFNELKLPMPKYNLNVGLNSPVKQKELISKNLNWIFKSENPDTVLVQGDTNSVLVSAISAVKMGIKVGHIEAGLRSFDTSMPEEINRIVVDHISDLLFCPTENSRKNLLNENIEENKVFIVGNTIVDAVIQYTKLSLNRMKITTLLNVEKGKYLLLTLHRPVNVDNISNLNRIIKGIDIISKSLKMRVIFPCHPRTAKSIITFKISLPDSIHLLPPMRYLDFLQIESDAGLIITDSGGVQEEACILKVPCITLRENTERPETIEVGSNLLVGTDSRKMLKSACIMSMKDKKWRNPFGDGKSAKKIVKIIEKN